MSNSDLEQARVSWLADEPSFREFGDLVKSGVEAEIKRLGIKADVSMRTKDIDSLIKKLILKPDHTYDSLGDKVGIRAVVRYQREVDEIVASMPSLCGCSKPDDTRQRLADEKDERVGYISVHLDTWLKDDDPQLAKFPKSKYRAEVQVRTLAQHLWSEISHDTSYKSGTKIRKDLKRRIHLLAGLIEVADNEFSRIDDEMSKMRSHSRVIALHSPVKVTETGLRMCRPEKGRQIDAIRPRAVRSLQSALRTKYYKIRASLRISRQKAGQFLCGLDLLAEREGFELSVQV